MTSLPDRFHSLSTADTAPNLDTLPEDIIHLIINHLQTDDAETSHNVPLSGVEKDAQDLVFQRPAWNEDLDRLANVCRRLREETFWKVRLRVLKVQDSEEDMSRTVKVVRESQRHYVQYVSLLVSFIQLLTLPLIAAPSSSGTDGSPKVSPNRQTTNHSATTFPHCVRSDIQRHTITTFPTVFPTRRSRSVR